MCSGWNFYWASFERRVQGPQFLKVLLVLAHRCYGIHAYPWWSNDLTLAKEGFFNAWIGKSSSNTEDIIVEPSYALSSISKIVARFYPRIKMGHILASLDIKAVYRAIVYNFYILRSTTVPVENPICFDYENFMEMNARRPLWCYTYCNHPVCLTDLLIDEDIARILGD